MTSTSPEFLPAGEDLSAARKNIMCSCVFKLCVYVRVHGCWCGSRSWWSGSVL